MSQRSEAAIKKAEELKAAKLASHKTVDLSRLEEDEEEDSKSKASKSNNNSKRPKPAGFHKKSPKK